jgi:hypothetical protein
LGSTASLKALQNHKARYDAVLKTNDFSPVRYYAILFDNTPDVMSCCAVSPEYDFSGNPIWCASNLAPKRPLITYSLFATQEGGAAVFQWLPDSDSECSKFLHSLDALSNDDIPHAIIRFTFEVSENTYSSPAWWEKLPPDAQKTLIKRAMSGIEDVTPQDCLLDDGLKLVTWTVRSRQSNVDSLQSNQDRVHPPHP